MENQIKVKKEFKNLIPSILEDEFQQLEKSIVKDGLRDAICVWNGNIVDGHNRYKICKKHKISFSTKEMSFNSETEAKEWIITNQLSRRNLSLFSKSELLFKKHDLVEELQKKAKSNQGKRNDLKLNSQKSEPINVVKELANNADIGEQTISRVKKLLESKNEPLLEKLRSGEISINFAYTELCKGNREKIDSKIDESFFSKVSPNAYLVSIEKNTPLKNYHLGSEELTNSCILIHLTLSRLDKGIKVLNQLNFKLADIKLCVGLDETEIILIGTKEGCEVPKNIPNEIKVNTEDKIKSLCEVFSGSFSGFEKYLVHSKTEVSNWKNCFYAGKKAS